MSQTQEIVYPVTDAEPVMSWWLYGENGPLLAADAPADERGESFVICSEKEAARLALFPAEFRWEAAQGDGWTPSAAFQEWLEVNHVAWLEEGQNRWAARFNNAKEMWEMWADGKVFWAPCDWPPPAWAADKRGTWDSAWR